MRRSTIPDWPRHPPIKELSRTQRALAVAAALVRKHGDEFVPFFQVIEQSEQEAREVVEARRRAFTLVINNDKGGAKRAGSRGSRGFAA
jgi:hypothetical protein